LIAIVLFTCAKPAERAEYALRTLERLPYNLISPEPIWLHIADDGSSQDFRDGIIARAHMYYGDNVSISNAEGHGYGASYNLATQYIHPLTDIVLSLEDDWELIQPLNLTPIVQVLREGMFGCVRLGYIGYTQELRAKFVSGAGMLWLALDPDSPEPHVFAGGPRLETVEFERSVGPWPEQLGAGATEFAVAHRKAARTGVAWPVDIIHPRGDAFVHIGTHCTVEAEVVTV